MKDDAKETTIGLRVRGSRERLDKALVEFGELDGIELLHGARTAGDLYLSLG